MRSVALTTRKLSAEDPGDGARRLRLLRAQIAVDEAPRRVRDAPVVARLERLAEDEPEIEVLERRLLHLPGV